MNGIVNSNLEATLRIRVFGPSGSEIETDCVIDTGFSGALTLPNHLISRLGLQWLCIQDAELADGRVVPCDVYAGEVIWNERRFVVEIDEADTSPLIGMALMEGFELRIQVRDGGDVQVTSLL